MNLLKIIIPILATGLSLIAYAEEKAACCPEELAAVEADGSVYQLDAIWTDQHGKAIKLSAFSGQPVLLTMGYASCQNACPRLAADLMAIERELSDTEKKQVSILFVSIDPARDSPEHLATFLKQYNVDQIRWSALRGSDDSVLELSVALGVRYRKLENEDFAHSNITLLLSPSGEIVYKQEGLGTAPTNILVELRKMLVGDIPK